MRKLVSIRKISELQPIEGADAIELAIVDGWKLVVKRGEFSVGEEILYCEIDSFFDTSDPRFEFLAKFGTRTFEGVVGHRLKTVKLKGALSQGLVLPLDQFPEITTSLLTAETQDDLDLAGVIGIKKYDKPIPPELAGKAIGYLPGYVKKTGQERCQNLVKEIFEENAYSQYEVTLKLDGESGSFINDSNSNFGTPVYVSLRELVLNGDENNNYNPIISLLNETGMREALEKLDDVVIQGEIMGPGIKGNREKLDKTVFFIFDIQDLKTSKYMSCSERQVLINKLYDKHNIDAERIRQIPVLCRGSLETFGIGNLEELLKFAEGESINHKTREGIVFKRFDGQFSFKAISNRFLIKEKD